MSTNHYSLDLPETTLWWTQHQPHPQQQQQQHIVMEPIPNPSWPQPTWFNSHQDPPHRNPTIIHTPCFNLNNEEDEQEENNNNEQATTSQEGEGGGGEEGEEEKEEKEPMFEKPLTPSDVGKLNRLVIPKQHAEKYFPLGAANSLSSTTASDSGECKGLLLSFEDEAGKCWRFRYSYWNSSQSYVLTKGWSRYVKDKRLDAGDVVSFERHRDDSQRLFIRWRRRSAAAAAATTAQVSRTAHGGAGGDGNMKNGGGGGVGVGWTSGYYCAHPSYPTHHHRHQLAYQQQHERLHAGKGSQDPNQRTRPLGNCSSSSSSSSSKVLRLFGVNMECQPQDDSGPSTPECSYNMQSTQGADTNHLYHLHQPPNSHPHMVHQQPYYY